MNNDDNMTTCLYRAGEKITVTPSSKELLFYPPEVEATITGGQIFFSLVLMLSGFFYVNKIRQWTIKKPSLTESCPGRLVDITGRAGLFLKGKVSPELEGVKISITERGSADLLITVATDEMGAYR